MLGPPCSKSWKTLGNTALQASRQVATCARKETERRAPSSGWGILYLPEWITKHQKTVSFKALPVKCTHVDASRDHRMSEKHCGFSIFQPSQSSRSSGILWKTTRITAFPAQRRLAYPTKIKTERGTLWVFTFCLYLYMFYWFPPRPARQLAK